MRGKIACRLAGALLLAGVATGAAQADPGWLISGVFSDGTALTGAYSLNQYGFISGGALSTSANGPLTAFLYQTPGQPTGNGPFYVEFNPGPYTGTLRLNFDGDTISSTGTLNLLTSSFECQNSSNCQSGIGTTRYIASGTATYSANVVTDVPEPAAWALMVVGFGIVGAGLRRRPVVLPA